MRITRRAARIGMLAVLAASLLVVVQGCRSGGRGPMERAGKSVDRAGEKVGDAFHK